MQFHKPHIWEHAGHLISLFLRKIIKSSQVLCYEYIHV